MPQGMHRPHTAQVPDASTGRGGRARTADGGAAVGLWHPRRRAPRPRGWRPTPCRPSRPALEHRNRSAPPGRTAAGQGAAGAKIASLAILGEDLETIPGGLRLAGPSIRSKNDEGELAIANHGQARRQRQLAAAGPRSHEASSLPSIARGRRLWVEGALHAICGRCNPESPANQTQPHSFRPRWRGRSPGRVRSPRPWPAPGQRRGRATPGTRPCCSSWPPTSGARRRSWPPTSRRSTRRSRFGAGLGFMGLLVGVGLGNPRRRLRHCSGLASRTANRQGRQSRTHPANGQRQPPSRRLAPHRIRPTRSCALPSLRWPRSSSSSRRAPRRLPAQAAAPSGDTVGVERAGSQQRGGRSRGGPFPQRRDGQARPVQRRGRCVV